MSIFQPEYTSYLFLICSLSRSHAHTHADAHTHFHLKSPPKLSCNSGGLWNCQADGRADGDCG